MEILDEMNVIKVFWCFPLAICWKRNDNSVSGCWEVEVGAKGATIWHFPELDSIMWHGQAKNFRGLRVEKYNTRASDKYNEKQKKYLTIWHFPELDSIMWHGQANNFREPRVKKHYIKTSDI